MAGTHEEYKYLTVQYMLGEREQAALEELLPYWQQYEGNDGSFPFKDWTITNLFQSVMEIGCKFMIHKQLVNEQFRQGLIDVGQLTEEFKTMQERKAGNNSSNAD